MEKYYYKARDRNGKAVHGLIEAENETYVHDFISKSNLIPIEVSNSIFYKSIGMYETFKSKLIRQVSLKDLLVFTQQLQIMYSVGVPLLESLKIINQQTENIKFQLVINELIIDISEGASISEAISKHTKIFDQVYINLIKVGETSGKFEEILGRLYGLTEEKIESKEKIKSALFYPKVIFSFLLIVFIFVVNFVLPKLKGFFGKLGGELPPITQFLLSVSDFFSQNLVTIFVGSFVGIIVLYNFFQSLYGKRLLDRYKLKTPVIGKLVLQIEMSSLCVALEILFRSGVDIVKGITVVKGTLKNSAIVESLDKCLVEIKSGQLIASGLGKGGLIPPMMISLISIGENSGSMPKVLQHLSKYYKFQIEHKLTNLSKAIEPILLIIIFMAILVLAVGVFLPMWSLSSVIRQS